jgi:putative membrane protein
MKVALYALWLAGFALFLGLIAYHGAGDLLAAIAVAGPGLVWIFAFRLVPMLADTLGWRVLLPRSHQRPLLQMLQMRWIGDAVNTLLPVAQVGGEFVRARLLYRTGVPGPEASASVVVDLTAAVLTQIGFALLGVALLLHHGGAGGAALGVAVGIGMFSLLLLGFYLAQRAGMFESLARVLERVARGGDWLTLVGSAARLDNAVTRLYRRGRPFWIACIWRFLYWFTGAGEVWLAMYLLGHPVTVLEALVLESLGAAVRAGAFAVPGGLGVQEGGYILFGTLLGVGGETALAVSLIKRVRELALGLPGLLVWQLQEGRQALRRRAQSPDPDGQCSKP